LTGQADGSAAGAIVLDIEGTTTPVAFVYEKLFPFARALLRSFLSERPVSIDLQEVVRRLRAEWLAEQGGDPPPPWSDSSAGDPAAAVPYL